MKYPSITQKHISIFRDLFHGREDVFAVRWQKGKKKGYMPAYSYDPYMYRLHKMQGGTFKTYNDKSYLPLNDEQIYKHLTGSQFIGIYPLLQNEKSKFIVADFDKENWVSESIEFIRTCESFEIPVYLERSQSGNGGHVWIFFEEEYPASKSRKLFLNLLEQSGSASIFDKSSSFDRLFPNQDSHSGKGLGNLIALPLYFKALEKGNSCFINTDTLEPINNQWKFIEQINRISSKKLDEIIDEIGIKPIINVSPTTNEGLTISLESHVVINKSAIPKKLIEFVKSEYNISNSEFFVKKKSNRSTWDTPRYYKLLEETESNLIIPRGAIGEIIRFCNNEDIKYTFEDKRKKVDSIQFNENIKLLNHQVFAVESSDKKDYGIIVSPPGSGKTIMALRIIANKKQPALIVVHRKQLFDQWSDRIEAFLNIPKREIGKIGQGKVKIGKNITIAMIQSLSKKIDELDVKDNFKTIIIDECHHIPAEIFAKTISKLTPFYQYGITATPFRKNDNGRMISAYIGQIISEIKPKNIEHFKVPKIVIRKTNFEVPYNNKTDNFEVVSRMLINDSNRNKLICDDIVKELMVRKKVIVITERVLHIEALTQILKSKHEIISISGNDTEKDKKHKWEIIQKGDFEILLTTGQFFGEGIDIANIDTLFLVYPFSFKGKLIQYIGRVQRSSTSPVIYDYHDYKIDYLHKLFLKRNHHYRYFDKQATLFDDPIDVVKEEDSIYKISKTIRVDFEELNFEFGSVSFNYEITSKNISIEFNIENDFLRPEFDILKTYFSKVIGKRKVTINISIELDGEQVISQIAESDDIDMINREIIDNVKFNFIEHNLFKKSKNKNIVDIIETENETQKLFPSNIELLSSILDKKDVKHYSQLRYLANSHNNSLLKLRFITQPFSFVFIISGKFQHHIILETLDTEEATYVWHIDKTSSDINLQLNIINDDLNKIQVEGRQHFLEKQPDNFSRIIHDYSDSKRGFIVWRDSLEMMLY